MQGFARFVALLGFISCVSSHGVMTKPKTRNDYLTYDDPGKNYNDGSPVSIPWPKIDNTFVCRDHDTPSKESEYFAITAGQVLSVEWTNGHPGDVFLYITYDGDKPNSEKNWFKIYNFTQVPGTSESPQRVLIPDYLPSSSHAILRWEMYALHVKSSGTIELYAACTDITISGKSNGVLPTPQVKIPGHLPLETSAYRDWDKVSGAGFYFTGPAIATVGGAPNPTLAPTTPPTTPAPTTPGQPPSNTPAPNQPPSYTPAPTTPGQTPAPTTPGQSPAPTTPGQSPAPNTPSSPDTCAIGSKGCSCTPGGACDAGLTCLDKYCLATSPQSNLVNANSGEVVKVSLALLAIAALLF